MWTKSQSPMWNHIWTIMPRMAIPFLYRIEPRHTPRGFHSTLFTMLQLMSCCWPSKSPDLNVIENLWSHISHSINALPERPRNAAQLKDAVHDQWRALSQVRVQRLVHSLHRRVMLVVEADGGHIPYWGPCCWIVSLVTSPGTQSCIHISVLSLSYAANKNAIVFIIFNVFHYMKFPKIWFMLKNVVQSSNKTFILFVYEIYGTCFKTHIFHSELNPPPPRFRDQTCHRKIDTIQFSKADHSAAGDSCA